MTHGINRRTFAAGAAAAGASLLHASVAAQADHAAFPNRPITLVVPLTAGGSIDVMARALATAAAKDLGQPMVVSNRPGAALTLGPSQMARSSPPDGYTIALLATSVFTRPHVQPVDYDPFKDFTLLLNMVSLAYGIVALDAARWKTLADLVADAKARPGRISYGSSGYGSPSHVAMEQFCKAADVKFTAVPFKGASETFAALYGGHIDFALEGSLGTSDMSRVRLLASPMSHRINRWPDVPTLTELGYKVTGVGGLGLGGPRNLPPAVAQRLHDAFRRGLQDPAFLQIVEQNCNAVAYMNGADYAAYARRVHAEFGTAVKEFNLRTS